MDIISASRKQILNAKACYQRGKGGIGYITYAAHLRAYAIYSNSYGRDQSADRLLERGGFGESELDAFYPEWRNHILPD